MKAASEKMVKVVNELKDLVIKEGLTSDNFEKMDEGTFKLLQTSYKLIDASNELTLKTAEMLESIDSKLEAVNKKLGL